MDKTTEKIARYATSLSYDDVTPAALHMGKKLLIDAIACAVGGYNGAPSIIARKLAAQASGKQPARVLCSSQQTRWRLQPSPTR